MDALAAEPNLLAKAANRRPEAEVERCVFAGEDWPAVTVLPDLDEFEAVDEDTVCRVEVGGECVSGVGSGLVRKGVVVAEWLDCVAGDDSEGGCDGSPEASVPSNGGFEGEEFGLAEESKAVTAGLGGRVSGFNEGNGTSGASAIADVDAGTDGIVVVESAALLAGDPVRLPLPSCLDLTTEKRGGGIRLRRLSVSKEDAFLVGGAGCTFSSVIVESQGALGRVF